MARLQELRRQLLDAIIGRRPDGIVLTGILHSPEGRKRLLASGIPVVETWDLTPTPIDMLVGFSHEKVGAQVAYWLHRRGYRHPAIVTADDHRAGLRRKGFDARLHELGISKVPACVVPAPSTLGGGRAGLLELLSQDAKLDFIFCSSDLLAHGVVTEAQAQGIKVPDELGVLGFGNLGFAADTHPPLSTVHVDGAAIAAMAPCTDVQRVFHGRGARQPGPHHGPTSRRARRAALRRAPVLARTPRARARAGPPGRRAA